ncbi:PKD domain-containing protein [Algoriphagus kandeliae]|uniref:PKD domain-containing protein n=1 Tax=Algoriphagus kandeliae TaxID=2562278 RepID=A0A4Y9QNP6_9BACT|nr:PQQ-dependent sugar dehydrogenase [Algoriphagus kandeliae]TFV94271.1 PKD domain-containing protein [Algoriphagus kandeliae]
MKNRLSLALLVCWGMIWSCAPKDVDPFATIKPDESRFTKISLVEKLNEPMELEVMDNGDVLFIERAGKLKLYEAATGETTVVGELNVYLEHEDGLLGLAKDPNFNQNHWIYLYYAPLDYSPDVNRLSRFEFKENRLDLESEKVILEIPVFRGCCHSGGSIEFDANGLLYLSTGDDTTPFESDNYNPIDERQDRPANVDAQKTSGNTNDLRGAIIRIKPEADGSYSIPEGNLFPPGTPNTRPEIYVMGNRNPYRISLDQHNGNLFWGEVGPDASVDSARRGPKGHDEINLARKPGFYGWPYFVGNNKPYWKYDFATQESLFEFDPAAPINTSPNNTGLEQLPPAQPALIWYPYDESVEFPMLETGGRNAMAGPVYYREDYDKSDVRFPGYYNGKLFIFDWMRNWVFTVNLTENFEYDTMERFMPSTQFVKPVDMQFAKDGSLYVLEYGTYWRAQNDDSGLYKIEFAPGNRQPVAKASASQRTGAAPLLVQFSSEGSIDFDPQDSLTYSWNFGDGSPEVSSPNPNHTFDSPGSYQVVLTVKDLEGKQANASIEIQVGNERPEVSIQWDGNRSFYFENDEIPYAVQVSDKEDGSIDSEQIDFTIDFIAGGYDLIQAGHQEEQVSVGENFITQAGCKACHAIENESVGPTYRDVSSKYKGQGEAKAYLIDKIRNGGGGVWGERIMPGHTHLPEDQVAQMVDFILGLEDPDFGKEKIPLEGTFRFDPTENTEGYYLIQANYTDQGANGMDPLRGNEQFVLRNPLIKAFTADRFKNTAKANANGLNFIRYTEKDSWIALDQVDLSGIKQLQLWVNPAGIKGVLEIRTGSSDGPILGKTGELQQGAQSGYFPVTVNLQESNEIQDLYFVLRTDSGISIWNTFNLDRILFKR